MQPLHRTVVIHRPTRRVFYTTGEKKKQNQGLANKQSTWIINVFRFLMWHFASGLHLWEHLTRPLHACSSTTQVTRHHNNKGKGFHVAPVQHTWNVIENTVFFFDEGPILGHSSRQMISSSFIEVHQSYAVIVYKFLHILAVAKHGVTI